MTWTKQPDIFPAGAVGGDDQVTEGFNVRYFPDVQPAEGKFAIVDENFYVEQNGDNQGPPYVVTTQVQYLVCSVLDDPGGSELWCEYEYTSAHDIHVYDTMAEAEAASERAAQAADGSCIAWDGLMPSPRGPLHA